MRLAKNILIKTTISLCAGLASSIGMRMGNAIWDKCYNKKNDTKTNESRI